MMAVTIQGSTGHTVGRLKMQSCAPASLALTRAGFSEKSEASVMCEASQSEFHYSPCAMVSGGMNDRRE